MAQELPLPKWGLTMEEATIVEWLVGPGDRVHEGTVLALVATDKIEVDWESPVNGIVVRHVAAVGETVAVGDAAIVIADDESDYETSVRREE